MKREGVKQVRQPTPASSSPATSTKGTGKSWFVRVLTGLGICLMLAVLRMLSLYVKNGGLSSLRSEPVDEGPTIRVQQPDAGMVLTTRQSASSGKRKAGDEEDEEDAEEAPPPPPPPAAKKIPPTLKEIESGLYRPDTSRKLEHYAGAWLISKRRLLEARSYIKAIRSLEGASFAVAGMAAHRDPRITLMTRDFFDFSVQHLSSTTNQLPSGSTRAFLDVIHEQTVSGVGRLRARAEARRDHPTHVSPLSSDERRTELTVAVIPFCNRAASIDPRLETEMYVDFNVKVRLLFFQATFWSVYRAFPRIVVTVGTEEDLQTVMAMHLPIFKTVNMKALFNVSAPLRQPGSVHFLPRETLLFLIDKLTEKRSTDFARFQYVYYTEADHILQLRSPDQLFNAIDGSGGKYAIAPHRLQTIAMPRAYPKFKHLWRGNPWQEHLIASLANKTLVVEHEDPLGSCCDDGRFYFANCGNWWYNCPNWGLRNFSSWVRFGEFGYTLPTGTEHGARCAYSQARKLCPVPVPCGARVPKRDDDVCDEIDNVDGVPPPMEAVLFPKTGAKKAVLPKGVHPRRGGA